MTTGNNRPALSRIKQAEQKTVDLEELVRQTLVLELLDRTAVEIYELCNSLR